MVQLTEASMRRSQHDIQSYLGHPCGLHEYNQFKAHTHKHMEKDSFLTYQLNWIWTAVKLEGKHSGRFILVLEYAKPDGASVSQRK